MEAYLSRVRQAVFADRIDGNAPILVVVVCCILVIEFRHKDATFLIGRFRGRRWNKSRGGVGVQG